MDPAREAAFRLLHRLAVMLVEATAASRDFTWEEHWRYAEVRDLREELEQLHNALAVKLNLDVTHHTTSYDPFSEFDVDAWQARIKELATRLQPLRA